MCGILGIISENQSNLDKDIFDRALEKLRNPLREIDRSKYITVVDQPENIPYPADERCKYIKIRFPFKNLIFKFSKNFFYFSLSGNP
jgi:hypothetical protein